MLVAALLAVSFLQFATPVQLPVQSPIRDEPLTLPAIVYPAAAKAARITGIVRLQIDVDATGKVTAVNALDGPPALRQAAIDAYTTATYKPLLKDGRPAPAIITTSINFALTDAPPTDDMQVSARFQPLHARCQVLSAQSDPEALSTCRQAVAMTRNFSPMAELEARAAAYNDLVLLLIVEGKKSTHLPEAGLLADQAITLVDSLTKADPHKPANAVAYITRAEVRSLAGDLNGSVDDCKRAEETLDNLLVDQGKKSANKLDDTENERAGNYRVQLRDTLLLHAIVLDRQHKTKEARQIRFRAEHI
jgi:TonB family protein